MSASNDTFGGAVGLCRKLQAVVRGLTESSESLSQALIHRQVDACWAIMSTQEDLSGQFHRHLQMWQELFSGSPAAEEAEVAALRGELRQGIARLQQLSRTNAALSRGFSGAIRRALDGVAPSPARRNNVYNRLGRANGGKTSVLISRVG